MKSPWKRRSLVTAIALTATLTTALSVALGAAHAATDKPMRIILPVGASSGVDTIMRAASPSLSEALDGQPVLLENLPGAGGTTATLLDQRRHGPAAERHQSDDARGLGGAFPQRARALRQAGQAGQYRAGLSGVRVKANGTGFGGAHLKTGGLSRCLCHRCASVNMFHVTA